MSTAVILVVLLAALLHAAWNALLKAEGDKHVGALGVALGSVLPAIAALSYFGLPARESWPLVAASAAIHTCYFLCLLNAYRASDFTAVYPISRGSAPVMTALMGALLLGEVLSPLQTGAVVLIACGVMSLVLVGRGSALSQNGLAWALTTGFFISGYSLNDGLGARLAGQSASFYGASAILNALVMVILIGRLRPGALRDVVRHGRRSLLLGGPLSFLAYALVTWAFTQAPIATVSALREVSVVFAMGIGTLILKERLDLPRILSTFVTLSGAMLLRLAR